MSNNTTINWGPIGQEVYNRTYSRVKEDGTKETWPETVNRVVRGNALPAGGTVSLEERRRLVELITEFKVLPAGRHLWVSGTGLPFTRNCFRAPFTERLADHFEFMADQLLTGGGVGANYSQEYISLAPPVTNVSVGIYCSPSHPEAAQIREEAGDHWVEDWYPRNKMYVVDDSREGWVGAWGHLFDVSTIYANGGIVYDVSDVRPSGSPIKTFGGTASGPVPLVKSLLAIRGVLARANGRYLTSVEAMECDHYIAAAVVAGGARRSARMSVVHWRDPQIFDFIACKTDPMLHWTTNISVEIDDEFLELLVANEPVATKVYDAILEGMYANGEPGIYNVSNASVGEDGDVRSTNPCGEIALEEGESCNIGSVNLAAFGTDTEGAIEAFRLMTRFLIRATLTPPPNKVCAQVESKNRRIGVGFLGFQEWAAAHGVRYSDIPSNLELAELLSKFRSTIRKEADAYADELGIPRPKKVTAIAPNGSIAQLPGTQPGIHPIFAKYFVRRVRYTAGDKGISDALDRGYHVEPCIYADNTFVVSFPVRDQILEKYPEDLVQQADEISLKDQLEVLAFVTRHFASGNDGNAVSFTASFDPISLDIGDMDWMVAQSLYTGIKGLTVFPTMSRPQSPYEAISREMFEAVSRGELVVGDSNSGECVGGACPIR